MLKPAAGCKKTGIVTHMIIYKVTDTDKQMEDNLRI
jgi:hypothetical protein